ncbi:hypothetical protein HG531_012604 [Fusarium graminearum]|nr:hypothetical protein HG531_012604 [Fusarium graminearum]
MHVGHSSRQRRNTSTANNTSNDETTTSLCVSSKTSHAQRHDRRETDGLEEENDVETSNTGVAVVDNGWTDEDNAHCQEHQKHLSGLDELHEKGSEESTNCEGCLRAGKELCAYGFGRVGAQLDGVVDEETRNGDLSACIAELSKGCMEELVLLDERSSTINIEDLLEMLVQRIEKAITETPKEEEDRDESNGPDGFSQGEFSCFGNFAIFDL